MKGRKVTAHLGIIKRIRRNFAVAAWKLMFWAAFSPRLVCSVSAEDSWPMLGHDAGRSGATATEVRPPFERKWYRLFGDEGLMTGVQPVVAEGKVFVGTMAGRLYAIDSESGEDAWTYKTGGAILHTCAVAGGKVFFGNTEGRVYAVGISDGKPSWSFQTGVAVWNSPLVHKGVVIVGGRDGKAYAIDAQSGGLRWAADTGGAVLSSPAMDIRAGRVYIASEDMRVYAFDSGSGRLLWRSEKLPGVSFRGYHPVVGPDGSVMVTVTPGLSLESFDPILYDMVKEIFGDFASWRHTKEENERLREENFKLLQRPETYEAQLNYITERLKEQPAYQTFFVLDGETGRQKFVTPIVYGESMNGTGAPPIVTPDGKVFVKFQALLRSRYQHYSPFLNVGYLDISTGRITPLMDQSRTYGWHDSLLLVHDEQCQLCVGGRVLINTHQDNVNAMDLDTLIGYGEPFSRSIHEPQPGEGLGIVLAVMRGESLPVGKEWLARGTAVYGGGSAIDVPVSIAGDSFYYIPTHEINAGAAVIAYRMKAGGQASKQSDTPSAKPTEEEWKKIQQSRWDWDMLGMPRLNHVLKALPGQVAGTQQLPVGEMGGEPAIALSDSQLDAFIWEEPVVAFADQGVPEALRGKLAEEVRELISRDWRPLVFPAGKHPREAYRFFVEPTETLYTLARAYNYIDANLQREVMRYVERLSSSGGPLDGATGQREFDAGKGAVRSFYDVPEEEMFRIVSDITRNDVARLYPLWLWGRASGDFGRIERNWKELRKVVEKGPNKFEEDCRNGYIAGLIAYCRMARQMNDEAAVEKGLAKVRDALRERLVYEYGHWRGGVISMIPVQRSIFARWRHLTPEMGRFLATHAGRIHRHLMDVYVDYHRPTWFLAWGVETMWRNESAFAFPTMAAEVFTARAMILDEPAEKLEGFVDIPWCKADLFHIQKLVLCMEAHGKTSWRNSFGKQ
ncbi:MAG: PQQ-like beta-propeller repeat protein [Sedimentisphaerales bacterium]|nr:PQQ-like beta-propeller repeat protein [Sedimentisphaerales bacterium]